MVLTTLSRDEPAASRMARRLAMQRAVSRAMGGFVSDGSEDSALAAAAAVVVVLPLAGGGRGTWPETKINVGVMIAWDCSHIG